MITFDSRVSVYLAPGITDMRKSFDTLSGVVQRVIEMDPLSGHLFAFCNRGRNRLKILWWDGSGLILLAKRLERGRIPWPQEKNASKSIAMTASDLTELLGWVQQQGQKVMPASNERKGWYDWKASPPRSKSGSAQSSKFIP